MKQIATAWARLASVLIWIVAGGFLVFGVSLLTILYQFVEPDRIQFLERWYCKLQLALTFNRQRYHAHAAIDSRVQYLFIQNHTSHLDFVAMYNATPHFKQGVELETHFDYPFYGWFMEARGTIAVPSDRNGALESLGVAIRSEIGLGHSILGFPEGHRTLTGEVGTFHDGLFRIAIEQGIPVVPVAVTGLYDVLHKGSLIIRPGNEVVVYADEPIATAGMNIDDVPALRDRVRDTISARVGQRADG
jgi:1-acyl-sn-glycerol-3-phosphate acyltransferase